MTPAIQRIIDKAIANADGAPRTFTVLLSNGQQVVGRVTDQDSETVTIENNGTFTWVDGNHIIALQAKAPVRTAGVN